MARRYWAKIAGRKVYAPSLAHLRELAQRAANQLGRTIQTGYDDVKSKAAGRRRSAQSFARNPDPGSYVDLWAAQERGRRSRLDYIAATKARRLAKSLRHRSGAGWESELARERTGKFLVTARNRKETFNLYRASRSAAEALGRQFEAAGYSVTLKPV